MAVTDSTRVRCVRHPWWIGAAVLAIACSTPSGGDTGNTAVDSGGGGTGDASAKVDDAATKDGSPAGGGATDATSTALADGMAAAEVPVQVDGGDAADTTDALADTQGSADAALEAGGDTSTLKPIALAEFATATAVQFCQANFTTCLQGEKMPFATQEGCVAALTAADATDFADLVALTKSGVLTFDPVAAAVCLAAVAVHCDDLDLVDGPAPCPSVFQGKAANGAKCTYNVECGSHYCADNWECPRTCKKRVALGAACTPTDKCAIGSVCFGAKCVAKVPKNVGAACGAFSCKEGLYCNSKEQCATLNKAGQPCDIVGSCGIGTQCIDSGSGGTCLPMPKKNEACVPDMWSDASTQCAAGLVCFNDGGEVGACEPKVAIGGVCVNTSNCGGWDVHCVGPGNNKTCQLLSNKGGPCQKGDLAFGEWGGCLNPFTCSGGKCIDLPKLGETCAPDIMKACAKDLSCDFITNKCEAVPELGEKCYWLCKSGLICAGPPMVCKKAVCP
ncbi:MAG: hypothetical protein EXR77_17170 [Myxococcales bacterium]|nr:hypothetical protein [Myxococcales bacterium]